MEPLISVIVPAYNVEAWLSRCLNSILDQTYKRLEVIVIDDGSTDMTSQIVDEYARSDTRIVPIHQVNSGLIEVRNRGIELAKGEYVTFVDGDDAIQRNMYEKLLKNAIEYDADISHCGMMFCFADGHKESHYETGKIIIQNRFEGLKDLLEGELIEPTLCNKLYKAELLRDSCLNDKILNNEDLLRNFVVFSRSSKAVFEDFCGYLYYIREGSMSNNKKHIIKINHEVSKARKLILENADDIIYPFAMKSWLSSLINAVNALCWYEEPDAVEYCEQCREILKKEYKNFHFLIKRQQVAAWLIVVSPLLHKIFYHIYQKSKKGR